MPIPPAEASSGAWASDPDGAVLRELGVLLTRESSHLNRAFAMGPVLALGCTGSRAHRLGWSLALTGVGLMLFFMATNSVVAVLGVAVTLVPGCLLASCDRVRLAELERRALAWRLTRTW